MLSKYFEKPFEMFPIYVWEKFLVPTEAQHIEAAKNSIRTEKRYRPLMQKYFMGYNYPIQPHGFIGGLVDKFNDTIEECFGEFVPDRRVFAYVSNEEINFPIWHTHTHTKSSISGVYYLQIEEGKAPIEFELDGSIIQYFPKLYDLVIFPHNLNHRPTADDLTEDYRISLTFDRIYNPQDKLLDLLENGE